MSRTMRLMLITRKLNVPRRRSGIEIALARSRRASIERTRAWRKVTSRVFARKRNTRFHKLVNGFTLITRLGTARKGGGRIRPTARVCHSAGVPAPKLAIARVRSTETESRESESS